MEKEILVEVNNVSKKFCLDLKTSLKYAVFDIIRRFFRLRSKSHVLRNKEFWAVNNVSFQLRRGECLSLIGHNGAGKSTLLKMLNGLIYPDNGEIVMRGKVGALIELGAGFNPILTGRENIYNSGSILGFTKKEIDEKVDDIIEFSEIGDFIETPVQNYSSGMKVRLGFAVAAQMEPDVLLIDEVLAVGDAAYRINCLNRISELLKRSAVIFVSHSMPQVAKISNIGLVLDHGEVKLVSRNLHDVINQYFSYIKDEGQITLGTGNATVKSLIIGNATEVIEYGETVDFVLNYSINNKVGGKHVVILNFFDQEMKVVCSINSKLQDNKSAWNEKKYSILFKNILNSGKYSINATILEINNDGVHGEILTNNRGILKIYSKMTNPRVYTGIVLESNWK